MLFYVLSIIIILVPKIGLRKERLKQEEQLMKIMQEVLIEI
jgi:hypothetical protein